MFAQANAENLQPALEDRFFETMFMPYEVRTPAEFF